MKRLSFITQFKIEFLLTFTGCRKVLGKMPATLLNTTNVGPDNLEPVSFTTSHFF